MDAPKLPSLFNLIVLDSVDSTNAEARRLAENSVDSAPEGTIVWALEQTAGRGRRGRTWESPKGNFYASIILRPDVPLQDASQFSFIASLAVFDTIGTVGQAGISVSTKWPNDVLISGRKAAGILLESQGGGGPGAVPEYLIVGVGVNLMNYPQDTEFPATSLTEEGAPVLPSEFLAVFAKHFLAWTRQWVDEGFERVRKNWLWRCDQIGKEIEVRLPNEKITGLFKDLDETGALLLEVDGVTRTISAGEVFFSPASDG